MGQNKKLKIGRTMQKVLLLLQGGLALSVTARLDKQFKILDEIAKEWQKINRQSLYKAIRNLYNSKLIAYKENDNGETLLILNDNGKKKALQYNLDAIKIRKPSHWDRLWRLVIFDIPENKKKARDALSLKLKQLGFYPLQKSVFIHPYDCKNEIDFLVEIFDIRPYVRFLVVQETDIDLQLKNHFNLG